MSFQRNNLSEPTATATATATATYNIHPKGRCAEIYDYAGEEHKFLFPDDLLQVLADFFREFVRGQIVRIEAERVFDLLGE